MRIAAAEFIKSGLHGLALWWSEHPELERSELTELVGEIVWNGFQTRS
jgi:hypothetical protein